MIQYTKWYIWWNSISLSLYGMKGKQIDIWQLVPGSSKERYRDQSIFWPRLRGNLLSQRRINQWKATGLGYFLWSGWERRFIQVCGCERSGNPSSIYNYRSDYLNLRNRIYLGTWNIQDLFQIRKLPILEKEIYKENLSVYGIVETHWKGCGHFTTADHTVYRLEANETVVFG